MRAARWLLLLAAASGAAAALLLSVGRRAGERPYGDRLCEQIFIDYADAYAGARGCASDGDCLVDPPPAGALRLCDRSRARGAPRSRIEALEARFAEARCRLPEAHCPPVQASACRAGRCTALAGEAAAPSGNGPPGSTPSTPRP